jgi:hypothetical protein
MPRSEDFIGAHEAPCVFEYSNDPLLPIPSKTSFLFPIQRVADEWKNMSAIFHGSTVTPDRLGEFANLELRYMYF